MLKKEEISKAVKREYKRGISWCKSISGITIADAVIEYYNNNIFLDEEKKIFSDIIRDEYLKSDNIEKFRYGIVATSLLKLSNLAPFVKDLKKQLSKTKKYNFLDIMVDFPITDIK